MRIDHFAYQQAVRVAGFGILGQLFLGLGLLIYGRAIASDTAFVVAATYVLAGVPIWIGLTLLFHHHRLERIEALEADELQATRGESAAALFERDGAQVAARRLRFMHTWLMPGISLVVALSYVALAWFWIGWFRMNEDPNVDIGRFSVGDQLGWQLAIAIVLALVAFIFSRFVAGMSKQPAWANLRGGAGAMVGSALLLLAIAIGIVFHFFQKPQVIEGIAYGLSFFMIAVAAEIVLNFIVNLYRPRRQGETPRPAFDSRVLSLFAAPDSIVRSINEAVNYQFGFDITSSWGYQLLLRSFGKLVVLGCVVLVGMSCLAVIEPGKQALRLRFGKPVGDVYEQTALLKLPWPFESVAVYDVSAVRELPIGNNPAKKAKYLAWGDEGALDPQRNVWIVAASTKRQALGATLTPTTSTATSGTGLADQFALIDSDLILKYRVRDGKLREYLEFCNDAKLRRGTLNMRERALRNLAMREVTQYLSMQPLNDLLSGGTTSHSLEIQKRIQDRFDSMNTGVEVISVAVPRLQPPGAEAEKFLEPSIAVQNSRKEVEQMRSSVETTMTALLGSRELAKEAVAAILKLREIEERDKAAARAAANSAEGAPTESSSSPEALNQRLEIERIMLSTPAQASSKIALGRYERWQLHMDARRTSSSVLGEALSWNADPILYQQRKLMEAYQSSFSQARIKFILGLDPSRVRFEVDNQEGDAGLNFQDAVSTSSK
jgi:membrane protease subunit HflK